MTKRKSKGDADKSRGAVPVVMKPDDDLDAAFATTMLRPTVQAARTLYQSQGDQHTVTALTNELAAQVRASLDGSTERSESMLLSHAHTLDELFHVLTRKALLNFGSQYLNAGERYMRLALKAQSQARTTLETLATIKNPPIYAKQANIAHGPQQVNNGEISDTHGRACAQEFKNQPNELLEQKTNEWLDTGAAGKAVGGNQRVEAVGAVDGSAYKGREKP
jgi:hypothetical protein